jgi:hypothetical protein
MPGKGTSMPNESSKLLACALNAWVQAGVGGKITVTSPG